MALDSSFILGIFGILLALFFYVKNRTLVLQIQKREEIMNHKFYEVAVLKEIGERTGYSLDVENITDVIISSLHHLVEYGVVSYILLGEENGGVCKMRISKPVSRKFINEMKTRMLASLSALLDKDIPEKGIEEVLSGESLSSGAVEPVRSFFNIPLAIGDEVRGVLTVAHYKKGLYKEEEMTILYKIVGQASSALVRLKNVIAREEMKLNSMVESMVEGVVMTDKEYRVIVANPAAKVIIGKGDKKEVDVFDFMEALGRSFAFKGKLEESVTYNKIIVESDVLINDKFYQIFISPVKNMEDSSGEDVLGGVVIFHDITHEKEVGRLRQDFTSMVIHELRTPLGNIQKTLDLIKHEGANKKVKTYEEYIEMMYKSSGEMLQWVGDLLDTSKIEMGTFKVLLQKENPKDAINECIQSIKEKVNCRGVSFVVHFAQDISEEVMFDKRRICHALRNLVENSLRFVHEGGQVVVEVLRHKNGRAITDEFVKDGNDWFIVGDEKDISALPDSIFIAVTDTGRGITEEDIPLLFNRFQQVKERMTDKEMIGTGMGLVIAKGIAEAHGGIIGARSRKGEGSTFYFSIPTDTKEGVAVVSA